MMTPVNPSLVNRLWAKVENVDAGIDLALPGLLSHRDPTFKTGGISLYRLRVDLPRRTTSPFPNRFIHRGPTRLTADLETRRRSLKPKFFTVGPTSDFLPQSTGLDHTFITSFSQSVLDFTTISPEK
ncbi:dicer-like 3 [Striga asiatica]|uniref:Dicer-like 3 n=1 Tax=Striga asiatica TaxID=4170 RepID=A0A5A7P1A4_STRAF|nr:dicer-like 3 [Striga asiatica]